MTPKKKSNMIELLDDGTLSEAERAALSKQLLDGPNSAVSAPDSVPDTTAEEHHGFVRDLKEALSSTRLQNENTPVDPTLVDGVVDKIQQLSSQETKAIGIGNTDAEENPTCQSGETLDLTGQRFGNYLILRKLSQGGMGIVYEAEDTHLRRRIAIKTMQPRVAANSQNRLRFMREAQAAAQVEHDHICPIFQVGEDHGMPFIAMPFLQGESLESMLKRGKIEVKSALQLAIEIAQGLSAAHAAGLVHRDIKPGNVWIESKTDGVKRVRLLDFGLAHFESEETQLTQSGMILGTPSYMAPEQARSEPVDARADLFGMGAILYEMLTGKRAFAGSNTVSILTSVAVENPLPPEEIDHSIPKGLSELVMQLLAKRPAQRPESAAWVAKKLQQLLVDVNAAESQRNTNPPVNPPPVELKADSLNNPAVSLSVAISSNDPLPRLDAGSSRIRWLIPALIGLSMLGGALAAVQLLFQTKDGILLVESDEETDLRFKNGALQIFDEAGVLRYTIKADETNRTLKPGSYRVKVTGADGIQLSTDKFELSSGGEVRVRVTARATSALPPKSDMGNKAETPSDTLFPGSLITKEVFDSEVTTLTSKSDKSKRVFIEDGRFVLQAEMNGPQEVRSADLIGSLEAGAVLTRCRTRNAKPFLNFCVRHDSERFRWLTVSALDRASQLTLYRSDLIANAWKLSHPIELELEAVKSLEFGADNWVDIAARWSLVDFDVWVNGQHVHGGKLPSKDLNIGKSGRVELCMSSNGAGQATLEVEYVMIWDQSGIAASDAAPSTLPGRNK